uniref:Uncharacterized protein n=1 Tax=Rhizophora mucronata TaxID=61149 RepID=A0A2P2N4T4_RHIMU
MTPFLYDCWNGCLSRTPYVKNFCSLPVLSEIVMVDFYGRLCYDVGN